MIVARRNERKLRCKKPCEVNEAQCINNVKLQSLNRKFLASINWVFRVNRIALVRPAKTLTDPRICGFVQVI